MKLRHIISRLALAATLAAPALAAGWTDRGEYDLVMSIRAEASAQKRVELLDRWQAKYPAVRVAPGAPGIIPGGLRNSQR